MRVLAIDQGTTSTRALVLDESGAGNVVHSCGHRQIYPHPQWVEHDATELLAGIVACIDAAGAVERIGIDNQGESCLAWNAVTGEPVSPVIVWQDRRTQAVIDALAADGAQEMTLARAGLPLDPYFSAAKLAWIVEHNGEAKSLLQNGQLRLGTTDAFFNDRLTGQFITDITTASRTSLMNLATGQWDEGLCELFKVPIDALPQIGPSMADGHNGTALARFKNSNALLCASVVDQQAALFGQGCRKPGDAKITFGTGAFALALTGSDIIAASDTGLLPTVAWQAANRPPVYALDGGVYCAGSALNWAKSLGLFEDFDQINQFEGACAISRHLAFVPALAGLGCPYWDGAAAGAWIGMSLDTSKNDLVRAVVEGVALRAGQVIEAMNEHVAIAATISIDGGMSANPYFCQFLANVLQRNIKVQKMAELTALGTALMAAGDMAQPVSSPADTIVYQPQTSLAREKQLFDDAVSRARGWR